MNATAVHTNRTWKDDLPRAVRVNEAGISPTEFKVLILPATIEEKTKGGIIIPEDKRERDQFAQVEGTLVAVSPLAFTYAEWPADASRPAVGDRVLFAKYAGTEVEGRDGQKYRLLNDRDVSAVLE